MRKLLVLSLATIIGTSLADTTDNLINQNGELDHQTTYYGPSVEQTYVIPEDAEWRNPTSIDWSVDVRSYDNAIGCYQNCVDDKALIHFEFYDVDGGYVDTAGTGWITLDHDDGGWSAWVNYSGSYTDETKISEVNSIRWLLDGRDTGYWAGNYGPQFRNAALTFEYDPVEESLIIEVEQEVFDLLDDLEQGHIDLHEFNDHLTDIQHDFEQDMEEQLDDMPLDDMPLDDMTSEFMDEAKQDKDNKTTEEKSNEPSDTKEHNEGNNNSNNNGSSKYDFPASSIFTPSISHDETTKTMQLLQYVTFLNDVGNTYRDIVSLDSYTAIIIHERLELEEMDDFYSNQAFYQDVGMDDSGIFKGYNQAQLRDNKEWYGSNNQLY